MFPVSFWYSNSLIANWHANITKWHFDKINILIIIYRGILTFLCNGDGQSNVRKNLLLLLIEIKKTNWCETNNVTSGMDGRSEGPEEVGYYREAPPLWSSPNECSEEGLAPSELTVIADEVQIDKVDLIPIRLCRQIKPESFNI